MTEQLHRLGTNLFSKDAVAIEITPESEIDFSKICRTCLRESGANDLDNEALFIIRSTGKLARLYEMFEASTGLKITSDDKLPRHICDSCLQSVKSSYSFHCQSQRANQILQSVLSVILKDDNNDEIENVKPKELHKQEPVEEKKPQEDEWDIAEKNPLAEEKHAVELPRYTPEPDEDEQPTKPEQDEEDQPGEMITYNDIPIEEIEVMFDEEDDQVMMEIEQLDELSEQDENYERVVVKKDPHLLLPCEFCGAVFELQRDLIQHFKDEHPEEKPFKCEVCSVSFVHIQSMRRHKKTHAPCPKQNTCPLCDRSFSRSDDLTRHIRTHTDERPYACLVCQKAFKQHTELKDHMLSHDDRKMYKCAPCNKEWRSRNGWYLHMKAHQDGRNGQRKQRVRKFEQIELEIGN